MAAVTVTFTHDDSKLERRCRERQVPFTPDLGKFVHNAQRQAGFGDAVLVFDRFKQPVAPRAWPHAAHQAQFSLILVDIKNPLAHALVAALHQPDAKAWPRLCMLCERIARWGGRNSLRQAEPALDACLEFIKDRTPAKRDQALQAARDFVAVCKNEE
jgi:hypothetical protein